MCLLNFNNFWQLVFALFPVKIMSKESICLLYANAPGAKFFLISICSILDRVLILPEIDIFIFDMRNLLVDNIRFDECGNRDHISKCWKKSSKHICYNSYVSIDILRTNPLHWQHCLLIKHLYVNPGLIKTSYPTPT